MAETMLADENTAGVVKVVRSSLDTIRNLLGDGADNEETRAHITQLEQLEQLLMDQAARLDAINRVLEEFNYSVAHELFAPLRRITGFTQEIKLRFGGNLDAAAVGTLDSILESTQQMNELIDALMQLSRLSHLELQPGTVDLSIIANQIIQELILREPQRKVAFTTSSPLEVTADGSLLEVALRKLLENAWKSTVHAEAARIELGVMQIDDERVFYVRDNGIGFDMCESGRLFHPFQRLHEYHLFPGNGIGLTAAKRVIDRHQGRIWAEGAPDKGATFYFTL